MESINSKPSSSEKEDLSSLETNPELFLKLIGMQTVRPDALECLLAHELASLACLNKRTYAKITKDTYSMNFVTKRCRLNPIKDWKHFNKFMRLHNALMKVLESQWPVEPFGYAEEYLEKGPPLIDWS